MSAPPHQAPAIAGAIADMTAGRFADAFVRGQLDASLAAGGRVHAIAGLQGSGKSTLAAQLVDAAAARGLRAVALSLDDFYLRRRERARLARQVHPLLATRGPPGTHDIALACEVLDALGEGRDTRLPRFDKLGDRRLPPSRWRRVRGAVDLVWFEGWCLKVPPQRPDELLQPINALERDEDADGHWRRHCNAALAHDYPALWARLPQLLFLHGLFPHGPGFARVPAWRWQQEQALHAGRLQTARVAATGTAMTRAQVARFVQLFERVSLQAGRCLPGIAQRTVRIDAQRRPLD